MYKRRFTLSSFSLSSAACAVIAVALPISLLSGCESTYEKQFLKSDTNYGTRTGQEQNIRQERLYGTFSADGHQNRQYRSLRYSRELSEACADLPGVHEAIVMVADNNAYAAVLLDESGTGMVQRGKEGNHVGTTRGMYDPETGRTDADPNLVAPGTNSYFSVDNPRDLSNLFKQRVAYRIREKHPDLAEVHITANRDFLNQMGVFREEARRGVDLNGYLQEFNAMVNDHFGRSGE